MKLPFQFINNRNRITPIDVWKILFRIPYRNFPGICMEGFKDIWLILPIDKEWVPLIYVLYWLIKTFRAAHNFGDNQTKFIFFRYILPEGLNSLMRKKWKSSKNEMINYCVPKYAWMWNVKRRYHKFYISSLIYILMCDVMCWYCVCMNLSCSIFEMIENMDKSSYAYWYSTKVWQDIYKNTCWKYKKVEGPVLAK